MRYTVQVVEQVATLYTVEADTPAEAEEKAMQENEQEPPYVGDVLDRSAKIVEA